MSRALRVGIIGAGSIAETHAKSILEVEGLTLGGIHCRSEDKGHVFAERFQSEYCRTLDELWDKCDAVCLTTPSGAHLEPALAAAKAGKHIMCEKPLEITTSRCDQLIQACREAGVILACIFQSRVSEAAIAAKSAVDAGRLGKLAQCCAFVPWYRDDDYYYGSKWRGTWALDGGGSLMNQGIHTLDLLQWIAGDVETLSCQYNTCAHEKIEVEDNLVAWLKFKTGALGLLQTSTSCYPGRDYRLEFMGDQGSIVLEGGRIIAWDFKVTQPEDESVLEKYSLNALGSGAADPKGISHEGHKRQLTAFMRAIKGEANAATIPGEEARKSVAIIEALYHSSRTQAVSTL